MRWAEPTMDECVPLGSRHASALRMLPEQEREELTQEVACLRAGPARRHRLTGALRRSEFGERAQRWPRYPW